MDYEFSIAGKTHRVSLERPDGKQIATVEGRKLQVDSHRVSPETISLLIGNHTHLIHLAPDGDRIFVAIGTNRFCLEEPRTESALEGLKGGPSGQTEGTITAPMPGLVIKLNVEEGQQVDPGQSLVVVEAMKMEHEMRSPIRATVEKVHVKTGQQVDAFQPLVELKQLGE